MIPKRIIDAPNRIRQKRRQQVDEIIDDGKLPKTAGPDADFRGWKDDVIDVSTAVPGTSTTGPISTDGIGKVTGLIVETTIDAINEKDQKQKVGKENKRRKKFR